MSRTLFYLLLFLFVACSHNAFYRSSGPYYGGPLLGGGTYLAEVTIELESGENFHFQTIFQRKKEGGLISAISSSGQKIFLVRDLFGQEAPELRIFSSDLQAYNSFFPDFYNAFRPLLLLDDNPAIPQPLVRERYSDLRPKILASDPKINLKIEEYDWEGHALKVSLSHTYWKAKISLREYTADN